MRDIKGYEGKYAVTSCGRVWSYKRKKFLKPGVSRGGYLQVVLCKEGKMHTTTVHRLVAGAYIPNPDNLPQINHSDEVKTHNWISNLEWCTAKYNNNYGTHTEKISTKIQCVETGEVFDSMIECERRIGFDNRRLSEHIRGMRDNVNGFHFIKI